MPIDAHRWAGRYKAELCRNTDLRTEANLRGLNGTSRIPAALEQSYAVATFNVRHFEKIPGPVVKRI